MKLHPALLAALLLAGCDKPEKSGGAADDSISGKPAVTKTRRPETPAERKTMLREELETASKAELPELRARAIAEVAWNAIEQEPEIALAAISRLGTDNPERVRLLQHHAMRLAEKNPDEALQWADSLASEAETAAAKQKIALVIAELDPERAARLLSESGLAGREFDVAVVEVLMRWAQKSPQDAASWVLQFPPGESRVAGVKAVVSRWVADDAKAAFAWVSGISDETLRGEAQTGLEQSLIELPREKREAALTHADSATREKIQRAAEEADR